MEDNTLRISEVETRTQDSRPRPRTQKNPRPRTALPRTDTLEAKDRSARNQGRGPRAYLGGAIGQWPPFGLPGLQNCIEK